MIQRTLALIKPETCSHYFICKAVIERIYEEGFKVLAARKLSISKNDACNFYKAHTGTSRFFYRRLVQHMISGPILALILEGNLAIEKWRQLLGSTKVYRTVYTDPNSLRGLYGLSDTRNVGHGCDSTETFHQELQAFFPASCLNINTISNVVSKDDLLKLAFHDVCPEISEVL